MSGPGPAASAVTRIDFAFGAPDRLPMACQVAGKRYRAGRRLVVYCSDATRLAAFDKLLWTFEDISFLPHVLANDPLAASSPIVLTAQAPAAPVADAGGELPWLMNLDDDCPPGYAQFARVLEIVSGEPADRQTARQRWRTYQEAGHDLHAHDLSKPAGGA